MRIVLIWNMAATKSNIIIAVCSVVTTVFIMDMYHKPRDNLNEKNIPNIEYKIGPPCYCSNEKEAEKSKVLSDLTGPHVKDNDTRLVSAISKYMIDHPRPFIPKFSYPLFETPQAKEAMKILDKVCIKDFNKFMKLMSQYCMPLIVT